jgi:hypothetical protein
VGQYYHSQLQNGFAVKKICCVSAAASVDVDRRASLTSILAA